MTPQTALIIQTKGVDIHCEAAKDADSKLWTGFISLYRGNKFDRFLVSTNPCHKTKKDALAAMKKLVSQVREVNLSPVFIDDFLAPRDSTQPNPIKGVPNA